MKVFWLQPHDGDGWLSPGDVVARLRSAFDNLRVDREAARALGEDVVGKYRRLVDAGLRHQGSVAVDVFERRWRDAVIVRAWDDAETTAPFEAVVKTEDRLELRFPPKMHFQRKRRTAEKVAAALGYRILHFDPED
jgi:hypothetical protein